MSAPNVRGRLRVVGDEEHQKYPKASLLLRAGARLVDSLIAWVLYQSTGPAGIVIALLYVLFADGMLQGQSPGKRLFGIKVIYLPTHSGARHRDSVLRNAPLGLVIILSMMPEVGLKAFLGGALIIGGIEAVRCVRDLHGERLGDVWAQTQVIDGKIAASPPQHAAAREDARAGVRFRVKSAIPKGKASCALRSPTT